MQILITGGAGYIGSVIAERFVQQKHVIVILDDLSTGKRELINEAAIFVKGSILNKALLNQIFQQHKFDLVIHCAAKTVVSESVVKPKLYYQHNVVGTQNILDCMQKHGCNNLIFCSSAAVYGCAKENLISETSVKKPCNPYGQTKLQAERLIQKAKVNYFIFRFFNVAGASRSLKYGMMKKKLTLLIPSANQMISKGKTPTIYGNHYRTKDGTCIRDYVHVEDLATACLLVLPQLKKNQSGIYNLGSGKGYSVLEIIKLVCQINNVEFKYVVKPNRHGDPPILVTAINKAMQELG
jgi:UDP-glucose 4-epimerase